MRHGFDCNYNVQPFKSNAAWVAALSCHYKEEGKMAYLQKQKKGARRRVICEVLYVLLKGGEGRNG